MKKFLNTKSKVLLLGLMLIVLVGIFIPTHSAQAWCITPTGCLEDMGRAVAVGILTLMSFITGIAGYFLNFVLQYTIVDMQTNLSGLTGINIAWKVMRDLMNMAFIFLLVYEGIKMIIGLSDTTKVKKFISMIVLASLLVNFSLFFTKVLIDASNVVTIGFYKAVLGPPTVPPTEGYGLSSPIMKALGLTSVYNQKGEADFTAGKGFGGILIFMIGSSLVFLVSAFVFFAVAILFVIRYVTLIILLMLSPVAYMGMALPFMKKYADDWWNALNSQLLFAPLYMILTWVILILMSSNGFVVQKSFTEVLSSTEVPKFSTMGLILNFAVIIGLLISSLVIAKSTSAKGSKHIGDATGKLTAFAGGAVMGGAARLGRGTLGRKGNAWANDEELKQKAAEGNVRARIQLAAGNQMAKRSFDVRAVKVAGMSAGSIADFGKVDTKKQNFQAEFKEKTEKAKKKAEQYKPSDLAVEQAKSRLQSDEFKEKEKKAKEKHDVYVMSDEYEKSDERKKEKELEEKNRVDTAELSVLEKQQKEYQERINAVRLESLNSTDQARKLQLNTQLTNLEKEQAENERQVQILKGRVGNRTGQLQEIKNGRDNWMSEEYKSLVATVGGTEKAKKDKILDSEQIKAVQSIEDAYKMRANALAEREENASAMWRYAANIIGMPLNVVGITSLPKTKADRQEIARVIRGVPKGKSTQQKAKDLLKEMQKESGEEEETKEGEKKEEKKTEEPKEPETPKTT